jgi:cytochrome c553
MRRWHISLFLLVGLTWGQARYALAFADDAKEADVRFLFQAKCVRCHGEKVRKAALDLSTSAGILKGGESGPVVVAGKPDKSLLYEKVHEGVMPPGKKDRLCATEIATIRRWIELGAKVGPADGTAAYSSVSQHDVGPILLRHCTVCHGLHRQEGGLDLRNKTTMVRGGKSGPAFVAGRPAESLIIKKIAAGQMPPRDRLVEACVKPIEPTETEILVRWIASGAPESPLQPDVATTSPDPLLTDKDRDYWAFQPPRPARVPDVTTRVSNPIDAFILQKLEGKGLALGPKADRLTLIRRVSFDLTGLPPEASEVRDFLADPAPDAYERLIDRLLASPRYGERWGRYWLDLAGYADSDGKREQDLPRPHAWRYRDYVIRAFNADKPYDRFLLEQIAGDELADYEHAPQITQELYDNLVATGFLRMAPDPTWANITGYVPDRLEVIADEIDVLGSAVMGLTMKCARCHSHKFDPIPQRDYYRLTDVFKGAFDENDWLKPEIKPGIGPVSQDVLGGRHLAYVTTAERKEWEAKNAQAKKPGDKLPEPRIHALWDRGTPTPTYIYRRGDPQSLGGLVGPGVPSVLTDGRTPFVAAPPWPGAHKTGRRLVFAKWLTQQDHPLTARVLVNYLWKHHFGNGIVKSVGNFGKAGTPPTHPELLDWLAREFVRQGWSQKALHRLMVTSATYQQSSAVTADHARLDPDNLTLFANAARSPGCRGAVRRASPGFRPARRLPIRSRRCRAGAGRRTGHAVRNRPGLAAAHLCTADAQAGPHAQGELRLSADESQLYRAPRFDGCSASAPSDEQRHDVAARRAIRAPCTTRSRVGSGQADRTGLLDCPQSASQHGGEGSRHEGLA